MNKQAGVIAPIWLYLAGAIALIVALAGLVKVWNDYTSGLDMKGYNRGLAETTAAYQKRDNAQLQEAIAAQAAAQTRAAQAEREAATAQSVASSNYDKGVRDGKRKTDAFIGDLHGGRLGLRDPGHQTGSSPACGHPAGQAAASAGAGGSDGAAGAQLSTEASEFLLNLTNEADDTARQLADAQAVIVSDRRLCNAQ